MTRRALLLVCALLLAGRVEAQITEVQQVNYLTTAVGTSHVITWSPTPTNGNLLAMCVVADNVITTPGGWTAAVAAADFTENQIIYKVASGEGTTTTVTTGSGHVAIVAFEYSGTHATPFDVSASATAQAQNISTGTTATTAQADEIAVACVGISGNTPDVGTGWNNSFVQQANVVSTGSGSLVRNITASKVLAATGAVTTTLSLTGVGTSHNVGLVATFKQAAGGGGGAGPNGPLVGVGR